MPLYHFDNGSRLTVQFGAAAIPANHLVMITVREMEIDVTRFGSKDLGSDKREGFLQLTLAGQTTLFPYAGERTVAPKFRNKVVYLGKQLTALGLHVLLTEVDKEERKKIGKVRDLLGAVAASPLASAHPAVGPGAGFLGGLLRLAQTEIDDDQEAEAFLLHEIPLQQGDLLRVALGDATHPLARVALEVTDLGAIQNFSRLSIRVNTLMLSLLDERNGIPVIRGNSGLSWLKSRFNCEASSGAARYAYSTDLRKINATVSWQKNELFTIEAAKDMGSRHIVPLQLSFAITPPEFKAEEWLGVLQGGLRLAGAVGADTGDLADKVTKQGPRVITTLAEFLANSLTLFSFNGAVLLDPPGGAESPSRDGVLTLPSVGDKRWRRQVPTDPATQVSWEKHQVGAFFFELEVVAE